MKTYIWTIPTRLFHWMLAIGFTVAYLLGGEEEYLSLHAASGSLIGGLILFRIVQGFTGPQYARFRDFPVSRSSVLNFLRNMRQSKAVHPGHNPLASVIMLGIMTAAILSAVSGMLIVASGETGFLGIRINLAASPEIVEELHEIIVNVFLVLAGIHLAGILADTLFHPANGTLRSIFTGYKNIRARNAALSPVQKAFSVLWIALPLLLFMYVLRMQPMPSGEKEKMEQTNETDEDTD